MSERNTVWGIVFNILAGVCLLMIGDWSSSSPVQLISLGVGFCSIAFGIYSNFSWK